MTYLAGGLYWVCAHSGSSFLSVQAESAFCLRYRMASPRPALRTSNTPFRHLDHWSGSQSASSSECGHRVVIAVICAIRWAWYLLFSSFIVWYPSRQSRWPSVLVLVCFLFCFGAVGGLFDLWLCKICLFYLFLLFLLLLCEDSECCGFFVLNLVFFLEIFFFCFKRSW